MLQFALVHPLHGLPAFPGAEGAGAETIGGRGGRVMLVTNLDDAGPGSLRAAIEAEGPRTIVFRVAGTIHLQSDLVIRHPFVTIAGQSAPGGGIALADAQLLIQTSQVIVRFLRLRPGDRAQREVDALSGTSAAMKHVIIDHCSASWSVDECVSIYRGDSLTVQWCIVSESLWRSAHSKGNHGFGGIWGGRRASFHHNLLAHHASRNPRINGREAFVQFCDLRNNVIFNWGYNSLYGGEGDVRINLVNCYYKPGPATRADVRARLAEPYDGPEGPEGGHELWWLAGNVVENAPEVSANNWLGLHPAKGREVVALRADREFDCAPVATDSAIVAYERVLAHAGAFLPARDSVDTRILREVREGRTTYGGAWGEGAGIIDSPATVGGWPDLTGGVAPADADADGMPDAWEISHELAPRDGSDHSGDADADGYTNLEEFLNATDPREAIDYSNPANNRFAWSHAVPDRSPSPAIPTE